ncbi:hypothetical protein [Desulfurobacterium sp.]
MGFFFWEAKRVFPSGKLESFKFSQLRTILASNPYAKYIIYDPQKLAIGVVNPRIFLFHTQHYKNNNAKIPASKIYAYCTNFPTYFCKNLLLGNDLMLLTKTPNGYFSPFYLLPPFIKTELTKPEEVIKNIITFFREKTYSVPEYLILQAHGKNAEPVNAIELMEEIKENLRRELDLKPIRRNNDKGFDSPNNDSGLSPGF